MSRWQYMPAHRSILFIHIYGYTSIYIICIPVNVLNRQSTCTRSAEEKKNKQTTTTPSASTRNSTSRQYCKCIIYPCVSPNTFCTHKLATRLGCFFGAADNGLFDAVGPISQQPSNGLGGNRGSLWTKKSCNLSYDGSFLNIRACVIMFNRMLTSTTTYLPFLLNYKTFISHFRCNHESKV